MAVREKGIIKILSDEEMQKLESQVIKLESLEQRRIRATQSLDSRSTKQFGIFAGGSSEEALPSSIIRKRRKTTTDRLADSSLLEGEKFRDRTSKQAIVKASEFTKLKNQVNANEKVLGLLSRGQGLISGASGLTTQTGIFGALEGQLGSKIPYAALAIFAAKFAYDKYVSQFTAGGTRDTRVKILDDDVSNIGVETETDILSGRKLFLSNPLANQGLPRGNSNTSNLRDGIRLYNLRREGSYFG